MKLDLDRRIGPILAILLANLFLTPAAVIMFGQWGWLIFMPWSCLAQRVGLSDFSWLAEHLDHLTFLGPAIVQGFLYSVILVIACFLDRLGRTAAYLFVAHLVAAAVAIAWSVLAPR
jgi:hypothetical protein